MPAPLNETPEYDLLARSAHESSKVKVSFTLAALPLTVLEMVRLPSSGT